jgi:hypothetical protein
MLYSETEDDPTWLDATHSASTVTQAFLFLTLAVFIRRALPQAFLIL